MAEETTEKTFGPKKRLTKGQALAGMAAGGLLLVVPWFIPSEEGSALYLVKMTLGTIGFAVLCLGSYYRP
jgi:hypothetical protein